MTKYFNYILGRSALALMTLVLLGSSPAKASHEIEGCDWVCDTNCTGQSNCATAESGACQLDTDITCGTGEGPILLKSGTDLDMHGKVLTCESGVTCGDAVVMQANNSKVFNGTSSEAIITGHFADGVDCGGLAGSEVVGITIENTLTGINNCKKVLNNVIKGVGRTYLTGNWGITHPGVTSSADLIQGNYIEGKLYGILLSGDNRPTVEKNVIHTTHYGSCAIRITNSDSEAKVQENTILGTGNGGFTGVKKIVCLPNPVPTGTTFAQNVCNEDHADCVPCTETVVAGDNVCAPFTSPFLP